MKGIWRGQESICQPVSLKSNLFPFAHSPANRLLALPGPFMFLGIVHKKRPSRRLSLRIKLTWQNLFLCKPSVVTLKFYSTTWPKLSPLCLLTCISFLSLLFSLAFLYYSILHYLPAYLCVNLPQNFLPLLFYTSLPTCIPLCDPSELSLT